MNITPDKNSKLMKNRFKITTKLLISKYKLKKKQKYLKTNPILIESYCSNKIIDKL